MLAQGGPEFHPCVYAKAEASEEASLAGSVRMPLIEQIPEDLGFIDECQMGVGQLQV
jgi:hypothetical protein